MSDVQCVAPSLRFLAGVIAHQLNNVQRGPAQEKQQDNDEYQPDGLELGDQPGWEDSDCDPNVTVDNNHQGEDQEKDKLNVKSGISQTVHIDIGKVTWILVTVGFGLKRMTKCGVENHWLDARQAADQPHRSAGDHSVPSVPQSRWAQGVDNSEVSVEGQKSEEEDRTVEAQIVDAAHNLAHNLAEDPVGELQVHPHEGKAAHEDQGRDHEVQQQDVGHGGQPLEPMDDDQDQTVSTDTEEKHKVVKDG